MQLAVPGWRLLDPTSNAVFVSGCCVPGCCRYQNISSRWVSSSRAPQAQGREMALLGATHRTHQPNLVVLVQCLDVTRDPHPKTQMLLTAGMLLEPTAPERSNGGQTLWALTDARTVRSSESLSTCVGPLIPSLVLDSAQRCPTICAVPAISASDVACWRDHGLAASPRGILADHTGVPLPAQLSIRSKSTFSRGCTRSNFVV